MRLNKFIALNTSYSRRAADELIASRKVRVNGQIAVPGQTVRDGDTVKLGDLQVAVTETATRITVMLNKPAGYVCSRNGQGSPTIYDLLPSELQHLNYAGRLDKDSSGLLILTNDGELINELTHPRYQKTKIYEVELDNPLQPFHQQIITDKGIQLEDGSSRFQIEKLTNNGRQLRVTMQEGRNRQIRRTFKALGYRVVKLHRTTFGPYGLGNLKSGSVRVGRN